MKSRGQAKRTRLFAIYTSKFKVRYKKSIANILRSVSSLFQYSSYENLTFSLKMSQKGRQKGMTDTCCLKTTLRYVM